MRSNCEHGHSRATSTARPSRSCRALTPVGRSKRVSALPVPMHEQIIFRGATGQTAGLSLCQPLPVCPHQRTSSDVAVGPVGARSERSREPQTQHSQAAQRLLPHNRQRKIACRANHCSTASAMCPALFEKIFWFSEDPNHFYNRRHPVPHRGAFRDRHGRWSGMRWTRQRRARRGSQGGSCRERSDGARTNDAANRLCQNSPCARGAAGSLAWTGADGEVVWSWRPDAGVKSGGDASGPTGFGMYRQSEWRRWQTSRSPGRARSKP